MCYFVIKKKTKSSEELILMVRPLLASLTACSSLPHKVKTQYVQILNIVDTSIKHTMPGQSTSMLKDMDIIMFDMLDTAFSYRRPLVVC